MLILTINSGSSSLKYSLYEIDGFNLLTEGRVERIGLNKPRVLYKINDTEIDKEIECSNHREALEVIFDVMGRKPPRLSVPRWILPFFAGIVGLARLFLGNRVPTEPNQVLLSGKEVYVDSSRAINELGLTQTPFRQTVQETYDWYREQGWLK